MKTDEELVLRIPVDLPAERVSRLSGRIEVVRSYDFKLNMERVAGPELRYESRGFFMSAKTECAMEDEEKTAKLLHSYCKREVLNSVREEVRGWRKNDEMFIWAFGRGEQRQMILYAIRHKPSGNVMPLNARNRGYTLVEPEEFIPLDGVRTPRLLETKVAATRALSAWLKGAWETHTSYAGMYGEDVDIYSEPPTKPPENRKAEEMEIINMKLEEVKA